MELQTCELTVELGKDGEFALGTLSRIVYQVELLKLIANTAIQALDSKV